MCAVPISRVLAVELDAQQSGSPGGVVTARAEDLLAPGLAGWGRGRCCVAVGGEDGVGALRLQAVEQLADGAEGEVQGVGNGGGGLALLEALPEGAAEGHRHRGRHEKTSTRGGTVHHGLTYAL
jgi:hypothetical protein